MRPDSDSQPVTLTTRRPGRSRRWALAVTLPGLLFISTPLFAIDSFDDTDYIEMLKERERGVGWNMAFGPSGGATKMLNGYQGYEDKGNVGIDLYFRPPVPQFPNWTDRLLFRFSADYFPLQVPKTVYYTKEDLYSISGTVICRIMSFNNKPENKRFIPFLGAGPALQWDRISTNHPAVDTSGTFLYLGYSASGGFMLPTVAGLRLIPEVRYQSFKEPNHFWTSHISYMVSLTYWPPANVEE